MFESTMEKCSIQLSVELIQPDIPSNSINHMQYRIESALPRVESNIFRKLIQTLENICIWRLFFFQCTQCNNDCTIAMRQMIYDLAMSLGQ